MIFCCSYRLLDISSLIFKTHFKTITENNMHIYVICMLLKKDKKGLFGNDDRMNTCHLNIKGICIKFNFSFKFCTVDPKKLVKMYESFRHY